MYKIIREFNSINKRIRIIFIHNRIYKLQTSTSWIDPWTNKPKWGNWVSLMEDNKLTLEMDNAFDDMLKLKMLTYKGDKTDV